MQDILIQGMICQDRMRFYAISAGNMIATAQKAHQASATCTAALGRTLMGTSILGAMEKNEAAEVTVMIKGGGPAGNIICVGRADASVKGYVGDPSIELPAKINGKLDVSGAVGNNGTITVIRDLRLKDPYVGQTELISGEIAEDFGAYFFYSQQQPSIVYLGVHINRDFEVAAAGGMIVQPLPGCEEEELHHLERQTKKIEELTQCLENGMTLIEACGFVLEGLEPVFHSELEPVFDCGCNLERLEKVVISLGEAEMRDMIEQDKGTELICRFCGKKYSFSKQDLQNLLERAR